MWFIQSSSKLFHGCKRTHLQKYETSIMVAPSLCFKEKLLFAKNTIRTDTKGWLTVCCAGSYQPKHASWPFSKLAATLVFPFQTLAWKPADWQSYAYQVPHIGSFEIRHSHIQRLINPERLHARFSKDSRTGTTIQQGHVGQKWGEVVTKLTNVETGSTYHLQEGPKRWKLQV